MRSAAAGWPRCWISLNRIQTWQLTQCNLLLHVESLFVATHIELP